MGSNCQHYEKEAMQFFESDKNVPCTGGAFGQMCHLKYGEDTGGHGWYESVVHSPYGRGRRKFFDFAYFLNFMNKSEEQMSSDERQLQEHNEHVGLTGVHSRPCY